MSTYQELNQFFKEKTGNELQRATLTRWVQEGRVKAEKLNNGRYNYNLESLNNILESEDFQKKSKASKEKPCNYIGKQVGYLLIKGIVPAKERKEEYKGTLMYCDCLKCGQKDIQVRFTYLTENGNYTQQTCGCGRKERAFLASSREGITQSFLDKFSNNFEKFLILHKILTHTTDKYYTNCDIKEYEKAIEYFYNDKQFNAVYDFWLKHKNENNTFYDWAKPSLDHITPRSKGGTNNLNNLQILTVFENLSKRDLTYNEWKQFKEKTNTKSDYFIENILI